MKPTPLTQEEGLNWLRLIRSKNVRSTTFQHLIQSYGSTTNALERLPDLARKGGRARRLRIASKRQANQEMQRAEELGMTMLFLPEPAQRVTRLTAQD